MNDPSKLNKFRYEQDLEIFEKRYSWRKVDIKEIKFKEPDPSKMQTSIQ